MSSPNCLVNGSATTNGVDVPKNTLVTIQLADIAGVGAWSIRCVSTDELQSATTITTGLTINAITKTATFTSPNVSGGAALIFESRVNGGKDANGRVDASLTTRFGIYVLTDDGSLRVGAFDETTEGSASYGWTAKVNAAIRAAGAGGITPTVSGTLPITVNKSNPANAVIGINAATTLSAGSMSSADKTKLDSLSPISASAPITITPVLGTNVIGISPATSGSAGSMSASDKDMLDQATSSAVNNTLARRDGTASLAVNYLTAEIVQSNSNLGLSADGFPTIVLDGQGSGCLLVPAPIRALQVQWQDQQNLTRSVPLDWSACEVSSVVSWEITDVSDLRNKVADPFANLSIECYFPHGCHITKLYVRNKGAGSGGDPLPANPPSFTLYRKNISTGASAALATVNGTLDGTYRGNWRSTELDLTAGGSNPDGHTVDSSAYRYYVVITPEFGLNALPGCMVRGVLVDRFFPADYVIGLE